MYPLFRFAKEMVKFRKAPRLGPFDAHVSQHMCWPWDLDPWIELNNGRTLTLFDLGRIPLAQRTGLVAILRAHGWGMTVAGNSTRYRRRVKAFDRFTMVSRMVGWDHRFIYIDQSMWKGAECCNQVLIRMAVTSARGIVAPADVAAALGHMGDSPALPEWVAAWTQADAARPWPPELPEDARKALKA
ncbi:acyl-CoA thioesterase [Paracoccus sp. 1_MG-2023]|uniref:acyl-CoA thioesterase n=1 Tax=unclassified Paracoccus (in: a-proteobacteria) TaxID=2688777 RepID=UPI001C09CE3C|nr:MULTISPECIES: acyl-CoA thioesterase [unclassified Paracoccus (in: a-proteobacteria)]MBU2957390.1 thioesterase family protein [Paracoccus sp. C2R09]MDO6670152.1 acyl-CoA thioesterase [Paracoccus sp. 1_MG-2023]